MGVTHLGSVAALSSLRALYPSEPELDSAMAATPAPPSSEPVAVPMAPPPPSSWRPVSVRDHILHLTFIAELAAADLRRDGTGSEAARKLLSGFPVMALVPEADDCEEAQPGGEGEGGEACWPLYPAHRLRFALDGEWGPLQPDVLSAGLPFVNPSLVRTSM